MKGTTAIKAELANYKKNELIFASRLYKEKLSDAVEEAAYYKALEKMCSAGELARAANGIYYLPKKNKYGSVPPSDREIVDAFTGNAKRIAEYIQNQLKEDMMTDQITLRELEDPFTGIIRRKRDTE